MVLPSSRLGAQAGHLLEQLVERRQELVERRVDEADDDRQAVHGTEEAGEVIGLERLQLGERGIEDGDRLGALRGPIRIGPALGGGGGVGCQDHAPHRREALLLEEHVLRPAQTDALRPERPRALGVARVVGIRPYLEAPRRVGPAEKRRQVVLVLELRLDGRQLAGVDLAGGAVDADHVALGDGDAAGPHGAAGVVDAQALRTGHAGQPHRARHDGGVGCGAAARGEHALGGEHAVHVVG